MKKTGSWRGKYVSLKYAVWNRNLTQCSAAIDVETVFGFSTHKTTWQQSWWAKWVITNSTIVNVSHLSLFLMPAIMQTSGRNSIAEPFCSSVASSFAFSAKSWQENCHCNMMLKETSSWKKVSSSPLIVKHGTASTKWCFTRAQWVLNSSISDILNLRSSRFVVTSVVKSVHSIASESF